MKSKQAWTKVWPVVRTGWGRGPGFPEKSTYAPGFGDGPGEALPAAAEAWGKGQRKRVPPNPVSSAGFEGLPWKALGALGSQPCPIPKPPQNQSASFKQFPQTASPVPLHVCYVCPARGSVSGPRGHGQPHRAPLSALTPQDGPITGLWPDPVPEVPGEAVGG